VKRQSFAGRVQRKILGAPRDVSDPHVLHRISLIAFLAWVGLGAMFLRSTIDNELPKAVVRQPEDSARTGT
jgi:hypothetical protein